MCVSAELQKTINDMVDSKRGILAADESLPSIAKSLGSISVDSTEENRRKYRDILLNTSNLGKYISSVILFEEALYQKSDTGLSFVELAYQKGIVSGVKADKGFGSLSGAPGDFITYGLDDLKERLEKYKATGIRFAKWREVYSITNSNPTQLGLRANAEVLARYAATCQSVGIVPVVEPEVLMAGSHDIDQCMRVTEIVLHSVFDALHRYHVNPEYILLKPNMILSGADLSIATPEDVATKTLKVLRRIVPVAVPSVNFLSGGQTPKDATRNLSAINNFRGNAPWQLSHSYGRAVLQPALFAWHGKSENIELAQKALLKRAKLNSLARQREYKNEFESE